MQKRPRFNYLPSKVKESVLPASFSCVALVAGADAASAGVTADVMNVSRSPTLVYLTGPQRAGDGSGLSERDG